MKEFRNACGKFATGIVIITTEVDGKIHGMTANGFMSVSLEPALILISIGNNQNMLKYIKNSQKYSISVLTTKHEKWSQHFSGSIQEDLEIDFIDFHGSKVIPNALAYFQTEVVSTYLEGDHTLFIGKVNHFTVNDQHEPLIYYKGYKELTEKINA